MSLKKSKSIRKKKLVILLTIAGALIIAAVIAIPLILHKGEDKQVQDSSLSKETKKQVQRTERVVVEGPDAASTFTGEEPPPGEVFVIGTLESELKNYGDDEALFHVKLWIFCDISEAFEYEGKTLQEYNELPILEFYDEEREIWKQEVYIPLDKEMSDAEQAGEEYAQGWSKHDADEMFREYFYENQPDDVIEAYEQARQQLTDAHNAYDLWMNSEEPTDILNDLIKAEIERLTALGLIIEPVYDYNRTYPVVFPAGYLTKQQIEEFPASSELGYWIMWADKETEMND